MTSSTPTITLRARMEEIAKNTDGLHSVAMGMIRGAVAAALEAAILRIKETRKTAVFDGGELVGMDYAIEDVRELQKELSQ